MEEATSAGKESLKACITKALCKRTSSVPDEKGYEGSSPDIRRSFRPTTTSVHVLFVAGDVAINLSDPEARPSSLV